MTERFADVGGEEIVRKTISKLVFISKIQESDVIDTRTMTINKNTWDNRLYRTIMNFLTRGESRQTTLNFIILTFKEAFDLVYRYKDFESKKVTDTFYKDIIDQIIAAVKDSKIGLTSLKKTYMNDSMFVSEIETLIKLIDAKLKDVE